MSIWTRKNIALHGEFQKAFFGKAYESDLVRIQDIGEDFSKTQKLGDWEYENLYKRNNKKNSVLQMFLLYDNVTLLDSSAAYDYSELEKTGVINVVTSEKEPMFLGDFEWDVATRNYAFYLKPMLIPGLLALIGSNTNKKLRMHGLSAKKFVNIMFDELVQPEKKLHTEIDKERAYTFIRNNSNEHYQRQKIKWDGQNVNEDLAREVLESQWVFNITESIGTLIAILDVGNGNDSIVLQSDYKDGDLKEFKEFNRTLYKEALPESYRLVKMSCEKVLKSLPKLETIEDTLRLKETKRLEIERLKEILFEVDESLKNGYTAGLKNAQEHVEKAVKELNLGKNTEKVSKWTTYMSLPVMAAEMYLNSPPVIGYSVAALGGATTFDSSSRKKLHSWTSVVR